MKKRLCWTLAIYSAVILMSGCSSNEPGHDPNSALAPEKEAYRSQLTEEEKEQDYIELQLAETVKFDGTIVPKNRYEQGLNSYYGSYDEPLTIELTNDEWDSLVMAKAEELVRIIEANSSGTFNMDEYRLLGEYEVSYPYTVVIIPYTDSDGELKELWTNLKIENDKTVRVADMSFYNCEYEYGEASGNEEKIGYAIRNCTPDYTQDSLDFGSSTEGEVFARTFIEEITGYALLDKSICVPVNTENIENMKKRSLETITIPDNQEDYYQYYYYWQIDGFATNYLSWSVLKDELGEIDPSADENGHQISLYGVSPSVITYDADGVRSIGITDMLGVGEVYKENVSVVDINEVLKNVTAYCTTSYTSKKITIKNIDLRYGTNITDEADGPIKKVWSPFWVVEYTVEPTYTTTCETRCIVYDAYTGDCVIEIKDME